MKRVAASPHELAALAQCLTNQVDDYQRIGSRLRTECTLGDPMASALDESARIAERLARTMAEITAFVAATARDLEAADHTLAGVVGRSGPRSGTVVLTSGGIAKTFYERRTQRSRRFGSFRETEPIRPGTAPGMAPGSVRPEFRGVTFAAQSKTVASGQGHESSWGTSKANVSTSYLVGGGATGEVSAGYQKGMVTASVGARAQLGLSTEVAGSIGRERLGARGSVRAFAGVMAEAQGDLGVGRDGLSAEAGMRVFAGGEVMLAGQLSVSGLTARGEAGVLYGAGFEIHGDVDISLNEIGASLDFGAALGLGGHLAFDVTVSPKKLAVDFVTGDLTGDALDASFTAASQGFDVAGEALTSGFDVAGQAFGGGVNAAGSAVSGGFKKLFG